MWRSRHLFGLLAACAASLVALCHPSFAAAAADGPRWAITSVPAPRYFPPSSTGDEYRVTATNVGAGTTSGPVTIEDTLPQGLEETQIAGGGGELGEAFTGGALACETASAIQRRYRCTYAGPVAPGDTLTIAIELSAPGPFSEPEPANDVSVSGGGAEVPSATVSDPTKISGEQAPFGVGGFFTAVSNTQAGAHPNLTTGLSLDLQANKAAFPEQQVEPIGLPGNVGVDLPPGLTGDALAVPRCAFDEVANSKCPESSAVGVAVFDAEGTRYVELVHNIAPNPGEPAAFAFHTAGGIGAVRLDTSLIPGSAGEYALHVSAPDVNEAAPIEYASVMLWGVPARFNGPGPDQDSEHQAFGGPGSEAGMAKPFVRNPSRCAGSLTSRVSIEAWQESLSASASASIPAPSSGFTGCGLLAPLFAPALAIAPDSSTEIGPGSFQAGAPAGYDVNLNVPQNENPEGLAVPDLESAVVTLPPGTVASPSAANGLTACSDQELGLNDQTGALSTAPAACQQSAQIGTVRIKTPLLSEELTGQVFLGQPECSPCGTREAEEGKMVRLFLQAQYGSGSDVRIKLVGRTRIDQQTGQLTAVFENTPQQPFEELALHLEGGPAAVLANPPTCGTAIATARLTPWSSTLAEPFTAESSSGFKVEGCGAPRFSPSFAAGPSSAQAGGYSPFSVTFGRTDQDQQLGGITVRTPPGLLGMVSHATQCPEAQANSGTCPQTSEIGAVTVAVGPGPAPFSVTDGRAYLTGPYKGAPFGLSIVVPAVAGPFDLGQEVVRAAIDIDPHTAALTVVSEPLPTIKDGIPLQVKAVEVNINRPEFMFNATNCEAQSIGATITSTQGAQSSPASPYQAVNCAALPFAPSFTASTQAKTSRAAGASLDVQVAGQAGQANIRKVDVQLPLALPSRLSTLNNACRQAQFAANPAGCPGGSVVGIATVHTPVLDSPLSGPAYFVSHGGAAFPDLVIVLQGEGVTIDLVGNTDVQHGLTFSRFESLPDAPLSSFELQLPEGPYSALAANGDLCSESLVMPTTIVAQSGRQVTQQTKIAVTGCPKSKPSIKVTGHRLRGNSLIVTVKTSSKGTVRISGRYLKTTTRKRLRAGSHKIAVALTRAGKVAKAHHHGKTRLHAALAAGGQTVTKVLTVRL